MAGSAICYPDCPGPRTTTAFARRWRLCRGRTLKPVISEVLLSNGRALRTAAISLYLLGKIALRRGIAWNCLETCRAGFAVCQANGVGRLWINGSCEF